MELLLNGYLTKDYDDHPCNQKLVFAEKYVPADEDIPIEIVRCKDCEHWKLNYYDEVETCFEHRNVDGTEQATKPDDFCSWGRRRTNGA